MAAIVQCRIFLQFEAIGRGVSVGGGLSYRVNFPETASSFDIDELFA
jgi:hypothetical protein